MRKKIEGLTDAIRQVIEEHDSPLWWKEICYEIKDRALVDIAPKQEEMAYGQPNFHHSVRRILTELVRGGEVFRVSRGRYKKHTSPLRHSGGID